MTTPSTCDHEWKLESTIRFSDKEWFLCFTKPVKDYEICIKCGNVKNVVYDPNPDGSRCC